MGKQIKLEYEGKTYTLEYNRRAIQSMEEDGFVATDIDKRPMSVIPELFSGAFLFHHPFIKSKTVDDIYAHMGHKKELIDKLAEMYNDTVMSLVAEPDENDEGNVSWTTNWDEETSKEK